MKFIILAGVLFLAGCNQSPRYELGDVLLIDAKVPVLTIFDNQTGLVRVCLWGIKTSEPPECSPWSEFKPPVASK